MKGRPTTITLTLNMMMSWVLMTALLAQWRSDSALADTQIPGTVEKDDKFQRDLPNILAMAVTY